MVEPELFGEPRGVQRCGTAKGDERAGFGVCGSGAARGLVVSTGTGAERCSTQLKISTSTPGMTRL